MSPRPTPPPAPTPPSRPAREPRAPTHPQPSRPNPTPPNRPARPGGMKTDFTWGCHMPGEVTGVQGRAAVTSPPSKIHPAGPGERLIAGLHAVSGATAAVEWEAEAHRRADAGESRVGKVVSSPGRLTFPTHRVLNESVRGGWLS